MMSNPLKYSRGELLTVDADDFDHGEGKEWQGIHVHLHQHCSDEKHHENHRETARDPQLLRDPEKERYVEKKHQINFPERLFSEALGDILGNLHL